MEGSLFMSDPRPFPSASTSGAYQKSIYEPAWETDFPVRFGVADGAQAFIYHWHDAVEILCGLSGNTTVGVERPYSLEASDVMIIGSGESHCLFPSGREDTRLVLMFDSAFFFRQSCFAEGKDCFGQIVRHSSGWSTETAGQIRECLGQIRRAFEEKAPGWKEYTAGQIHLLTAALIRGAPARPFLRSSLRPALPQDDALRKVLTYLSRHYLEPLTLAECARALGFNPSYLSAMFSQRTGSSFHQYLISLRLKQAEWLLTSGELPISEISAESGFSSDKTFYRTFREHYGKTPGEYRKQQQKR